MMIILGGLSCFHAKMAGPILIKFGTQIDCKIQFPLEIKRVARSVSGQPLVK